MNEPAAALPVNDYFPRAGGARDPYATTPASTRAKHSSYNYQADAQLIQACLEGDQAAWSKLVERYGRLVYSIPFRWGLSSADADDVFQNVFTIVYRRLARLRNQASLSAWLITITSRECWRVARSARAYAELDETMPDEGSTPFDRVQHQHLQRAIHEAISRLDARSQELLNALFFESQTCSYEEIAARLGLAVGSIGSARARCLSKLEAILTDMDVDLNS
ncbi:MAG TPA: sigma-70 family RNA polymerase sigma factor [Anaerolineae bacterium]|nr:sigma-70 family RNA polymerase sigma factor [Anaerolineae bacterium]